MTWFIGPALPEVNATKQARMQERTSLPRQEAFGQVYQAPPPPAMMKINQALGRLVRAPGQRAKVLLHCYRFAEPSYHSLLVPDYRKAICLHSIEALQRWLLPSD